MKRNVIAVIALLAWGLGGADVCWAAQSADVSSIGKWKIDDVAPAVQILAVLSALSILPGVLVAMTSFTRIIVVLSILRYALGMQQTPPNVVLIALALFLTLFKMSPIIQTVDERAVQPFLAGKVTLGDFSQRAAAPLREFMVRQTREEDMALMVELSGKPMPSSIDEIGTLTLIPAFMLSELYTAFKIGFVIFLPFVLIDLVVASVLMSMGMMMVPPMMISLPIKIMVFVLIDGWNLVVNSLMRSFG